MQITSIEIANLNVALKHPISTPLGALDAARNVVVKIITDSGIFGWGKPAPLPPSPATARRATISPPSSWPGCCWAGTHWRSR
ncbi:hypothetical protein [Microbulbifer taiwanensis]|uniref:hypothetical protein n=1 Tax=Microbulbifer taiwanensis TaxID=986746 RepID=UPI00360C7B5F